ncbi:DUF2345 domain-containing protein, partial [Chromobacterium amazonense]|uniref:DUF2345 domain-containing protein n=1 Tax=Chromobacterium amazonense TaxID=1382803 RepID=UPI00237E4666
QPQLVLSGPAGIASVTEQSQTLTAGTNLNLVAQRDANHTTGRRWIHNVGKHISLFVAGVKDKVALKLIAAKGKVQVQAQSDAMEITADKDVTITSVKGKVQIAASQEILLASGGGYIRIAGGNIEVHCPDMVSIKGAEHQFSGPTSLVKTLKSENKTTDLHVRYEDAEGNPLVGEQIKLQSGDNTQLQQSSDADGWVKFKNVLFDTFKGDLPGRRKG